MSLEITRHGFSTSIYGLVISLNGALVVLCELPLTALTTRYPARRVMALGYLLIGAGFASNALPRTLPLLVLTVVLFTLGEMTAMPVSSAYAADLAPAHQRGLYMGAFGMTWSVAFIVGPSLGMMLFAASPLALWASCGGMGILAAAIILTERSTPSAASVQAGVSGAFKPLRTLKPDGLAATRPASEIPASALKPMRCDSHAPLRPN
jgi:MFS family permease